MMKRDLKYMLALVFFVCANVCTISSMTQDERKSYLQWMQNNLPEVNEFTAWQQATGELPPDFDKLPKSNLLPDPLMFLDGRLVGASREDWEMRRSEIMGLFEKYVTGTFPPKPTISRVELLDETKYDGYYVRNVKVVFGPEDKASVRIRVVAPIDNGETKYPVLISPSLTGWDNLLLSRGYISVGFAGNDFMDDAASLREVYPDYDFATLPRRAWLVQIVLDYMETLPQVNMKQVAVFGYSRDGKMATIAAALDERIAVLIAGSTGVGGLVPWRLSGERGGGESIESTTRMFPGWFIPRLRYFSGHEDSLPVDANLLLALIAPRAVLMEWGLNDEVANGWAMEQACKSARTVYARYGAVDKVNLMQVAGFHGSNDQSACVDFLDIQFGKSSKKWRYDPVFPWDFDEWVEMSGENKNTVKYDMSATGDKVASLDDWNKKAQRISKSIEVMLGEKPVKVEVATNSSAMFGRRTMFRPGPTEVAKKTIGNPGQLAPDVPAWVIAAGGQEYGWLEPAKNAVSSKRITFGADNIVGDLYYPADVKPDTKLPVVVWLHGYNYPLGYMWVYRRDLHPILALVNAGFAVLAYDQTGFGTRVREAAPFYDRYPHWSRMGKMVDDVSSAVTALQKDSMIDGDNISVLGFTLGGTVGLYAAALDNRIKQVVSVCGFTPMRTDKKEYGTSGMTRYSHLYGLIPRLGFFDDMEESLPYDYDDIMSLVAPRSMLIVQNTMDRDAVVNDVELAVERARNIYGLQNAADKLTLIKPDDYARLTEKTQTEIVAWLK